MNLSTKRGKGHEETDLPGAGARAAFALPVGFGRDLWGRRGLGSGSVSVDDLLVDHPASGADGDGPGAGGGQCLSKPGAHGPSAGPVRFQQHRPAVCRHPADPPLGKNRPGPPDRPPVPGLYRPFHEKPDHRMVPGGHPVFHRAAQCGGGSRVHPHGPGHAEGCRVPGQRPGSGAHPLRHCVRFRGGRGGDSGGRRHGRNRRCSVPAGHRRGIPVHPVVRSLPALSGNSHRGHPGGPAAPEGPGEPAPGYPGILPGGMPADGGHEPG